MMSLQEKRSWNCITAFILCFPRSATCWNRNRTYGKSLAKSRNRNYTITCMCSNWCQSPAIPICWDESMYIHKELSEEYELPTSKARWVRVIAISVKWVGPALASPLTAQSFQKSDCLHHLHHPSPRDPRCSFFPFKVRQRRRESNPRCRLDIL